MIGRLEEHVTQTSRSLIDQVAQKGEADFATDVAAPLPMQVICELVGAPSEDRGRLFELSNRVIGIDDREFEGSPADAMQAAEMLACARELAQRQSERPRDDIVTWLLQPDEVGAVRRYRARRNFSFSSCC